MIKKTLKSLCILSLSYTSVSAIEIKSATHAVDIAGKQRMFTQRMLKDYAMAGMHNTFGKPDEDLKTIIVDFQDHMDSLVSFTQDKEIQTSLENVKKLWEPIKKILEVEPEKEKVAELQKQLDALLKASNDATVLFAKASGKASGKIINISGRQRMLSQRMASLYMLKVWEIDDPEFKTKLTDAMTLFKESLGELEKSEMNNEEITLLLKKVKRSFMFFEMMSRSKSKFVPTLIYKKSNDMLVNMNSATQKYVALEAK